MRGGRVFAVTSRDVLFWSAAGIWHYHCDRCLLAPGLEQLQDVGRACGSCAVAGCSDVVDQKEDTPLASPYSAVDPVLLFCAVYHHWIQFESAFLHALL